MVVTYKICNFALVNLKLYYVSVFMGNLGV